MCPSPFSSRVLGTLERNKLKMKSKYIINLRAKMIYLWKKEKRGEMNICAYVCMYIHISCECTHKGTLTHTRETGYRVSPAHQLITHRLHLRFYPHLPQHLHLHHHQHNSPSPTRNTHAHYQNAESVKNLASYDRNSCTFNSNLRKSMYVQRIKKY